MMNYCQHCWNTYNDSHQAALWKKTEKIKKGSTSFSWSALMRSIKVKVIISYWFALFPKLPITKAAIDEDFKTLS